MRVLIVRTSALGDVVHALPVLTALRRGLPGARIGWVVEESIAPLLNGHPDLDELLVVALRRSRRHLLAGSTAAALWRFTSALRRFAPDVVLDLMGNHKAGVMAVLSGSRRRVGPARRGRREPSSAIWINHAVEIEAVHAVDRGLALLGALGLPAEAAEFGGEKLLPAQSGQSREAEARSSVVLHPGAGWGNKRYPAAWWGEALRQLHALAGLPARVAVAPGEEGLAAEVIAAAGGAAAAAPAPDLPALVGLLRSARLVLGGDTGPTHLAHALGTPVLMVMGPTDPDRNGPYRAPERVLARRLPCSFCYRRFAEVKGCLLEIPPRRIAARASELLALGPRSPGPSAAPAEGSALSSRSSGR